MSRLSTSVVSRINLADISRNPAGLTQEKIRQIKPRDMVAAINLNISPQVKTDLIDLERHQSDDPFVRKIKVNLTTTPAHKPMTLTDYRTAFYKEEDRKDYCTFSRTILPACLENKVSTFSIHLLGMQEVTSV
jgi:hypothetical protein